MRLLFLLVLLFAAPAMAQVPVVTHHKLDLPGRSLTFTASLGVITLPDDKGMAEAEVGITAYTLDGADLAKRPVTFAINGGPGAGSAWLELGALGPWRLNFDGMSPTMRVETVPNGETWLDFTDLVFLDPPGTGTARLLATGEEVRKRYWSVQGDLEALAQAMRRWLQVNNRMMSPKAIAGESYGGFRGPRLARLLPASQGVAISALVLISPALDLGLLNREPDPIMRAGLLPSMAASHRGTIDRAMLADAEAYARGDYIVDLLRGPRDAAAQDRIAARLAPMLGLDAALIRRLGGKISAFTYLREHGRAAGVIGSAYDASVVMPDPFADQPQSFPPDPMLEGLQAPFVSALTALHTNTLNVRDSARYQILNEAVNRAWNWDRFGMPQALSALRTDLAADPALRVLVTHGLTDLVTPYFATQLMLDAIPDIGAPGRVRLLVLPGGHMSYTRDNSRAALRDAAQKTIAP